MENTVNICSKPGCGQVAKLRCPECVKKKVKEESYFCGKECFKGYWIDHKKVHDLCRTY